MIFQSNVKVTGGEWYLVHNKVKTWLVDSLLGQCVCHYYYNV